MELNYQEYEQAQKMRRNTYWRRLRQAFADYQEREEGATLNSFKYYMERQYGLRVNMVGSNIDGSYQIIDDSKHTLFLLKYGSN